RNKILLSPAEAVNVAAKAISAKRTRLILLEYNPTARESTARTQSRAGQAPLRDTTGPRPVPVRSGHEAMGRPNVIPRPLAWGCAANRDGSRSVLFRCFE